VRWLGGVDQGGQIGVDWERVDNETQVLEYGRRAVPPRYLFPAFDSAPERNDALVKEGQAGSGIRKQPSG
jgi:hypothetical protein